MSKSPISPFTLSAAVTAYLQWHTLRGSSPSHRKEVQRMLGDFAGAVGWERSVGEIERDDCAEYVLGIQARGGKPNTWNAYDRTVRALFRWLVEEGRISKSPMQRLPKPKVKQDPIQPLSESEVAKLLKQPDRASFIGLRDAAFMGLLVDSGLRLSEATGVRLADIDSKARSISVRGKGGKPRVVFYGDSANRLLKAYLGRRPGTEPHDRLFVSSLDEPLCRFTMSKRMQACGKAAGIAGKRVSPHALRDYFTGSVQRGCWNAIPAAPSLTPTPVVRGPGPPA